MKKRTLLTLLLFLLPSYSFAKCFDVIVDGENLADSGEQRGNKEAEVIL